MADSSSAEKRARQGERRRLRNRSVRGETRTRVRKVLPLVAGQKPEEAEAALREAVSALDKAAQKGVIHENAAARRKSRLTRQYNRGVEAAAQAKQEAAPKTRRRTKKEA